MAIKGGRTYVQKDGRLEIHPCVTQDIGSLGPLPKKGWNLKTFLASLPLHMSFDLFEILRLTVCESITRNSKNALFCPVRDGIVIIYIFIVSF